MSENLFDKILKWRSLPFDSPEEQIHREAIAISIAQLETAERESLVLKRIGTAFNLHQTVQPAALHAAHTIKGALNLLSVRVWMYEKGKLICIASAHQSPSKPGLKPAPAPEKMSNMAIWEVWEDGLRALLPLHLTDRNIGYLELMAPREQEKFLLERSLHATVAEQLALVLQSAQLFESVELMATSDPLTGLSNHRSMQDFLREQCEELKSSRKNLGVVMVDVDHFRQFNEAYGHDAGDFVLKSVANALAKAVGEKGMAARYGGEEFTLILPSADEQLTEIVALSALDHIRRVVYHPKSGGEKPITASLGYSFGPQWGVHPQKLLKVADNALYAAKHTGRNKVCGPDDVPKEKQNAA